MLLSPAAGVLLAIAVGSSVGLLGGPSVVLGIQVTLASVAAALLLARVQRRRHVWRAGLAVGRAPGGAGGGRHGSSPGQARFEIPPLDLVASLVAAFLSGAVLLPLAVVILVPLLERILGLAQRPAPARPGEPEPPGAEGAHRPGARDLAPLGGGRRARRGRGRGHRRRRAARPGGRPLPRPGQGDRPGAPSSRTRAGRTGSPSCPPQIGAERVRRHVEEGVAVARRWKLPAGGGRHRGAAPRDPARLLLLVEGARGPGDADGRARPRPSATAVRARRPARPGWS